MKYLLVALCGCEAQIDLDFNDEPRITVMLVQIISACAKHNTDKAEVERLTAENERLLVVAGKFEGESAALEYMNGERTNEADKLRAEVERLRAEKEQVCGWTHDNRGWSDEWTTGCNNDFLFEDGTPQEHGYNFCPCCGKHLLFMVIEDEEGGEG